MLFVYREPDKVAALPLLIRPLAQINGLEKLGMGLSDATSVYGYPGPVASAAAGRDPAFLKRFGAETKQMAKDLSLVSLFSRLNPVLGNRELIPDIGSVEPLGETVSIDLSLSKSTQWSQYRANHRRNIRSARREGMHAYRDGSWRHFERFVELYQSTMQRLDADEYYRFDRAYLARLCEALGERAHLFVAEQEGVVCCAALMVHTGRVIQYHLSGTDPVYQALAPLKLVLDRARLWGNTTGARFLHLGGGLGSQEDSLFHFKAGFSSVRHRFQIWKWIVQSALYDDLVAARYNWLKQREGGAESSGFFPSYRAA
jgi:hypothetical protein